MINRSLFLSFLIAFLFSLTHIQTSLAVSTTTRDLGTNIIRQNGDFSASLYLSKPSNSSLSTLTIKQGLWSGTYADISVYLNDRYLGQFRASNAYLNPGPEYSSFSTTGFLVEGTNSILFRVVSFYNPRLYYVEYVIGEVSLAYDGTPTTLTEGPVADQWAAHYNGPGNTNDGASAMAIDSLGNIYVTGYSDGTDSAHDYATIKYDTSGNQLWVVRYNGPGNGNDEATAIAVDANGNVYVTGGSGGIGTSQDFATIKYSADGNELWAVRYNGPGNGSDRAIALVVDAEGSIYVTGSSQVLPDTSVTEYTTIKYNSDGNEIWTARYNGLPPASDESGPCGLKVDAFGNVYVTGSSRASDVMADYTSTYATVKYDQNGNEKWVAVYNGKNGDEIASALAVDATGNVYVTGTSSGADTNSGYATIKYDSDGNKLWETFYSGPNDGSSRANALAMDSEGNVYVTGYSSATTLMDSTSDYATVKYDANGNEIWVARYNGPYNEWDCPTALAVDVAGNVYVTGLSYNQGTLINDYATIKYDTSGNQLWVARYNGPGNGNDEAMAIAVDGAGNVYVAGAITGMNSGYDFATIKLVPNITDDGGGGDSNNGGGGSGGGGGGGGGGCFLNAITN